MSDPCDIKPKIGWFTTWSLGLPGCCAWFGCKKKPEEKSKFCEEHGKTKIKGIIVK